MTARGEIEEAVWQEFSCYYLPEELGPGWQQHLPQMARASAGRLIDCLDDQRLHQLEWLLEQAWQNPDHPMVRLISDATMIDWFEGDGDWQELQQLLVHLVAQLQHRADAAGG